MYKSKQKLFLSSAPRKPVIDTRRLAKEVMRSARSKSTIGQVVGKLARRMPRL
jgi:hypothetical protein